MGHNPIEQALIENGVDAIEDLGYVGVNCQNIFTDPIYSSFFKRLLKYTTSVNPDIQNAVCSLLVELEKNAA